MKNLDMVKVRLVPDYKLHSDVPIASSEEALKLLREELSQFDREAICVMNLNAKGKPINASIISIGDITSAALHPRELFKCSILSSAAGFILIHNHPSGDLVPSEDDILVTSRLISGAKLLGIRLIDHIIVGLNSEYSSMKENGMLEALERAHKPDIEIPKEQNQEMGTVQIRRVIEGTERLIPLTRDEVCKAYFAQQEEFDRETVTEYLEQMNENRGEARYIRDFYGMSIKKVLSSKTAMQRICSEFRKEINRNGHDEYEYFDIAFHRTMANLPRRKRTLKEQER